MLLITLVSVRYWVIYQDVLARRLKIAILIRVEVPIRALTDDFNAASLLPCLNDGQLPLFWGFNGTNAFLLTTNVQIRNVYHVIPVDFVSPFVAVLSRLLNSFSLLGLKEVLMWPLRVRERSIIVFLHLCCDFNTRTLLSLLFGIWTLEKFI